MAVIHGTAFDDGVPGLFDFSISYGLFGTGGDDIIYGYQGNDVLVGLAGNDVLEGGSGADEMHGGSGDDVFIVDNPGDLVGDQVGPDSGTDTVYAYVSFTLPTGGSFDSVENLSLMAGAGAINGTGNHLDNVITGNGSNNALSGLGGSDTLIGGGGADTMRGGAGNDYYYVENSGDAVIEEAGAGTDTVFTTISHTLTANVENLGLQAGAGAIDGFGNARDNVITGNASDNELRGYDGADLLKGGGGNDELNGGNHDDFLYGESGHDTLIGGGGDDEMYGGTGNDTYSVNSAGDVVMEYAGEGSDTVNSGLDSYTLGVNVENLNLSSGLNGTGNALVNVITGNILDNVMDGRGGADTMVGRQGDDTYVVDNAGDVVIESADQGSDTVLASVSYVLGTGVSVEMLATTSDSGTTAINLTGNSQNNSIRGNDGNNILNGGGGSDALIGLGGTDTASYENNIGRVVAFLVDSDVAPGQAFELAVVGTGQEAVISSDVLFGIENLRGSSFNDSLTGNSVGNILDGRGGSDQLSGGGGDDIYVVDNADDSVIESGGQGIDTVVTSVSYTLTAGADVELLATSNDAGTAAINLAGNANGNEVRGNNGNNVINGGNGNDFLTGLGGQDQFLFNTALDAASNVDEIVDFTVADDTIVLENAVFTTLTAGALGAGQFVIGTAAQDANDRIIYNNATGALFYDSDGTGGAAARQFAELSAGLGLSNLDFLVV
jgi:Ca2+-binding RTX toxin-like protein